MSRIRTLADYEEAISEWHDLPPDCEVEYAVSLPEFLGLTFEQYQTLMDTGEIDLDDDGVYEFALGFPMPVPGQRTSTACSGNVIVEPVVDQPICAHCGHEALGFATVNTMRVCHDEVRDCYQDITVWGATIGGHHGPFQGDSDA